MDFKQCLMRLIVGVLCGVLAFGCQRSPSLPPGQTAMVMGIVSGQTIEVQYPNATDTNNQTVRLIGIQAPAYGQEPWNNQVKAYLADTLLQQTVQLEWDQYQQDGEGLQFAYVWLADELINQTLVAEGYVLAVARSPNLKYETRLQEAQNRARLLGLGIWNPDQPMRQTPNEFRAS